MLIEFTVKNFRSIKEEQALSMVKDKGDELEGSNTFVVEKPANIQLLKSAVIYGANASGKSNLLRALAEMESIVRNSASSSQVGDEFSLTPFLFDEKSSKEETEFEVSIVIENVRYQYGFSATKFNIISEWLIAYPKGRPQRWFSRVFNNKSKSSDYVFGDSLTGKKTIWQNATRENALFLSTAVQLNSDQLKPIFNWFQKKLRPTDVFGWGPGFTASLCESQDEKDGILSFLKAADFDIHDIQIEKSKFDTESIPETVPASMKNEIIKSMKDKDITDIKTIHKTASGQLIPLDFDEESDGTQKFFTFIGPWIDSLKNGYILVIDELHDTLHPKMVKYLVGLFNSPKTNPKNAQLIFTTHETSILNQDVFRRDQIWFCEKNENQETSLYPLTDFSPRKSRENIELGYLSGRYGAIPFTSEFDFSKV
jgi:uncharacterized protein